jgi:hypothetical protein
MAASLTEKEFLQHVNTKFHARLDADGGVDLELIEVKGYMSKHVEQTRMERFSAFFDGPGDLQLPQGLYSLRHEQMGEFEIFLVPIARNESGFRYEAVFNYFVAK